MLNQVGSSELNTRLIESINDSHDNITGCILDEHDVAEKEQEEEYVS